MITQLPKRNKDQKHEYGMYKVGKEVCAFGPVNDECVTEKQKLKEFVKCVSLEINDEIMKARFIHKEKCSKQISFSIVKDEELAHFIPLNSCFKN
jgi:hypothetical protein